MSRRSFRVGLNNEGNLLLEFEAGGIMTSILLDEIEMQQVIKGMLESVEKLAEYKKQVAN